MSRERAPRAWGAALAAVAQVCGAAAPVGPGAQGGGFRPDKAGALRRKFAIYTAVCGLGCAGRAVAEVARVDKAYISRVLRELEDARDGSTVDYLLDTLTAAAVEILNAPPEEAAA